jgi:hypothetical protein
MINRLLLIALVSAPMVLAAADHEPKGGRSWDTGAALSATWPKADFQNLPSRHEPEGRNDRR